MQHDDEWLMINFISVIDECITGSARCDPKAICTDTEDGYRCNCPSGYIDVSPDPVNESGRICAQCKYNVIFLFLKTNLCLSWFKKESFCTIHETVTKIRVRDTFQGY